MSPFLHFSDTKALVRECNRRLSDPRGVGGNGSPQCTQAVAQFSIANSLKSIQVQPSFYPSFSCECYSVAPLILAT